ncbi:MAG: hypothetical protein HUJ26_12235 [Planctomycetaceae bacterium]|nr:hypothetical protein [Planctomycetaceae bacterium]
MPKRSFISEEIENVTSSLKIPAHPLEKIEAKRLREIIYKQYEIDSKSPGVMINSSTSSVHDPQAWSRIREFLTDGQAILFLREWDDDELMWVFPDGESLHECLAEAFGFVFFVTDKSASYLLAFDDHDCLIGAGRAEEWVRSLQIQKVD